MPTPPVSADTLLALLESFPWAAWREKLRTELDPVYRDAVSAAANKVADTFTLHDPYTSSFMTRYVGERITQLDDYTRDNVSQLIRRVLGTEGAGSTTNLAELVAGEVRDHVAGYETWRAARIARTESAIAYNHGTVLGLKQEGGEFVDVVDGDQDGECAEANGSTWTVEQALNNPIAHPNCTRVFLPHTD